MRQHLLFEISKKNKREALVFLSKQTNDPLYQIEEDSKIFIGGFFDTLIQNLPEFLKSYSILEDNVDWQNQWESFSPNMNQGLFELDLSPFGRSKKIKLKPGPGFGDLSHPTTNLCLKAMYKLCPHQNIIDFGCGSGILSVAAYAFGAFQVFSLEIDQLSIIHTKENLELNNLRSDLVFEKMPKIPLEGRTVCIINMTFGEQKIALQSLDDLPQDICFLSSGILKSQKDAYLKWGLNLGIEFKLIDTLEKWALFLGYRIK